MYDNSCYSMKTPLGEIFVYVQKDLPKSISFTKPNEKIIKSKSCLPAAVEDIMLSLEDYFHGYDIQEELAHHLLGSIGTTPFGEAVLKEVTRIPRGETRSYRAIAELVGKPRAARAVGGVMGSNPFPIIIPCHRVVKSDGSLGGYGGGQWIKQWLLEYEGTRVKEPR
jgi:O-6-methylguanine DNA methyltransferase